MVTQEDISKLKKEDIYPLLDAYYQSIGRTNPPHFRTYTLEELKKCLSLFRITVTHQSGGT